MSRESDRDRSIERLLKTTRRESSGAASPACVDAETLAAWSEGALPSDEAARLEAHLADCARCQATVAMLVRTQPVAPAAGLFWKRWPIRLAVPLAAAAAVLIWIASTHQEAPAPASIVSVQPAATPPEPISAPPVLQSQNAPRARQAPPPAAVRPPPAPTSPPPPPPSSPAAAPVATGERSFTSLVPSVVAGALAGTVTDSAGGTIPGATVSVTRNGARIADVVTDSGGRYRIAGVAPGAYEVSVTMAGFRPLSRLDVNASTGTETVLNAILQVSALSESVTVTSQVASPAPSAVIEIVAQAPVGGVQPVVAAGGGRGGGGAAAAVRASPPAPPARWRVMRSANNAGGVMLDAASAVVGARAERSTDGGATWQPASIDPAPAITAGVAPSSTVCWLIGQKGVVFLTTDGLHFARVGFPEAVDLVSIRATDARHADITAADGRVFTTTDGGATWR